MFRIYHPNAHVYDAVGRRKPFEYIGGMSSDDIQYMVESGEWDLAGQHPYQQEVLVVEDDTLLELIGAEPVEREA